MRHKTILMVCLAFLLAACGAKSQVQDKPELHMSRNFGYSSLGGGAIQGNFSIAYSGPAGVNRVSFLIDGQAMGEVNGGYPFSIKFDTGSYSLGEHTLGAVGYTVEGTEIPAQDIHVKFVSASAGWKAAMGIAVPILVLVLLITLVGIGGPVLLNRGKKLDLAPGTQRNYGLRGGTICPRCKRPYGLHLFSLHVGFHKLDRCPFCGKWAFVRPRSLADLRSAESAELEEGKQDGRLESSAEDKLRKDIEDSRYQDM